MSTPASILVVADHGEGVGEFLSGALRLARSYGAGVELYLCEAEQAYELAHQYERDGVERARAKCIAAASQYLRQLRAALDPQATDISITAECESPLYAAIVRRVMRSSADLVIKRADLAKKEHHGVLDPNDWELMATCPATVMITRGRPWRVPARFAAAVDVSEGETAGLPKNVLQAAAALAGAWRADLEVIYAEARPGASIHGRHDELRRLCAGSGVPAARTHVLQGDPLSILPAFAAHEGYDVLILGALAHRRGAEAQPGGLTSKLLDTLSCDFVLVKPPGFLSPLGSG